MIKKIIAAFVVFIMCFFLVNAEEPDYIQGETIFIETGVDKPDTTPTWYASMVAKPYAPVFEILATKGTQGRYYQYTYAVTLKNIVQFHGHDCEGLTHAACCLKLAFDELFPGGFVDRSNLGAISGTGPCWSDVTTFLTGARIQYGNLNFFKNKEYNHSIIVYRLDTGKTVLATWKIGINNIPGEPVVLPERIKWKPEVNMKEVLDLKSVVKNSGGNPTPYQVDLMRYYQFKHINDILSRPLNESYQIKVLKDFNLKDWIDETKTIPNPHVRSDIRLKDYPYRDKPIIEK
jgi:hypothetical protein